MKKKIILCAMLTLLFTGLSFAQSKVLPKSIISTSSAVKKFHDVKELKEMNKGQLIELYIERVNSLNKILPYVALATRPGVTLADLGIPDLEKNNKNLEIQGTNTTDFLNKTVEFERSMLPYCDTGSIVRSIIFFENTIKSLREFNEL